MTLSIFYFLIYEIKKILFIFLSYIYSFCFPSFLSSQSQPTLLPIHSSSVTSDSKRTKVYNHNLIYEI